MKNVKRLCCLLALLSVALLPGCGRSDSESFYEIDTFERYGEEIRVLIGHDQEAISIYNNDDKRDLLDKAALPTQELHDNNWEIELIDTTDFNGDGNSDLRITLAHEDENESYIVWEWEEGKGYVYQPDDSWFYMALMLSDVDISFIYAGLTGRWNCQNADDPYKFIDFDWKGNWELSFDEDNAADSGYLRYEPKEGVFYLCSNQEGAMDGNYLDTYGAEIYISAGYSFDKDRLSTYAGRWMSVFTGEYDYLDIGRDGSWQLWFEGNVMEEGHLACDESEGAVWIYSGQSDDEGTIISKMETDGCFWFGDYGYFRDAEEMEKILAWIESTKDSEEYQLEVSMFTGTWYLDNDLSAETYFVIDNEGNWSCYQRASGDAEGTVMYSATFSDNGYEFSGTDYECYYEEFITSDGEIYRISYVDDGILAWGADRYYRID